MNVSGNFVRHSDLYELTKVSTGRTTRLIDKYVQDLFNAPIGEWIYPKDHARTSDIRVVEHLVRRLESRMKNEHDIEIEVSRREGWKIRLPIDVAERLVKFRAEQHNLYVTKMQEINPNWKEIPQ